MNPCYRYLALPMSVVKPSGIGFAGKLVEVVSHAAELAHMVGVFLRQPFLYMVNIR